MNAAAIGNGDKLSHIRVSGLTKRYSTSRGEVLALDDVSISIGAGEKVVLLGPSGCGKTTLLRCIAGLESPDAGEIEIDGKIVYSSSMRIHLPPERRGLSMVFQSYALWPHMTVFQNVAYPLINARVPKADIEARVMAALRMVNCDIYADRYPSQLSGGQQQRVSLARAIVGRDETVLFDEPLSNVDALVREQLRNELAALQKKLAFSTVYVTHDQSEALALADRIAVMRSGRIAQIGSVREIYERPASRYVAGFTGAANIIEGRISSVEKDVAAVQTAIGPLQVRPDGLAADQAISIVIRPEHLQFSDARPAVNAIRGRIELATFLGVYTEYILAAQDQRLVVRSTRPDLLDEGSEVWVTLDTKHAVTFATDGGHE
ncbi:ABC transporter ATP-binding protein [Roseiarcaceae bacterium H3SJ34-1]|uniref:ABC transporter ATP-binding protein n=1 Tax=Terripilifer ovatus TaxID=3032367 RepID=UPI003AB91BCB|nr:ABC transporter ATP-binding protein [Roseiarcaceae bacterium H3SJ34-1]